MEELSAAQRETLDREGYLVVEHVLDPSRDIGALMAEYEGVLDRVAAVRRGRLGRRGIWGS